MILRITMDLWNEKNLARPPTFTYKCEKRDLDLHKFRNALKDGLRHFQNEDFMTLEAAVLSRIIYRMKMKFRSAKDFKSLEKVNRALNTYFHANIGADLKNLLEVVPKDNGEDCYLPTKNMLNYILVRIQGVAKLMERLYDSCKIAAYQVNSRFTTGHFWKVAFIAFAIVSRIFILAKYNTKFLCELYGKLLAYSRKLENKGINWLPEDYILPNDLRDWLNVPWVYEEDYVDLTFEQAPKILDFFDLANEDDDDVQFCNEYVLIDEEEKAIVNDFNNLIPLKDALSRNRMRGFSINEDDIGEEIVEVITSKNQTSISEVHEGTKNEEVVYGGSSPDEKRNEIINLDETENSNGSVVNISFKDLESDSDVGEEIIIEESEVETQSDEGNNPKNIEISFRYTENLIENGVENLLINENVSLNDAENVDQSNDLATNISRNTEDIEIIANPSRESFVVKVEDIGKEIIPEVIANKSPSGNFILDKLPADLGNKKKHGKVGSNMENSLVFSNIPRYSKANENSKSFIEILNTPDRNSNVRYFNFEDKGTKIINSDTKNPSKCVKETNSIKKKKNKKPQQTTPNADFSLANEQLLESKVTKKKKNELKKNKRKHDKSRKNTVESSPKNIINDPNTKATVNILEVPARKSTVRYFNVVSTDINHSVNRTANDDFDLNNLQINKHKPSKITKKKKNKEKKTKNDASLILSQQMSSDSPSKKKKRKIKEIITENLQKKKQKAKHKKNKMIHESTYESEHKVQEVIKMNFESTTLTPKKKKNKFKKKLFPTPEFSRINVFESKNFESSNQKDKNTKLKRKSENLDNKNPEKKRKKENVSTPIFNKTPPLFGSSFLECETPVLLHNTKDSPKKFLNKTPKLNKMKKRKSREQDIQPKDDSWSAKISSKNWKNLPEHQKKEKKKPKNNTMMLTPNETSNLAVSAKHLYPESHNKPNVKSAKTKTKKKRLSSNSNNSTSPKDNAPSSKKKKRKEKLNLNRSSGSNPKKTKKQVARENNDINFALGFAKHLQEELDQFKKTILKQASTRNPSKNVFRTPAKFLNSQTPKSAFKRFKKEGKKNTKKKKFKNT